MTEPLLCRTADGKIHWTTQSAGRRDCRDFKTCCGQQVVSVIHEPITAMGFYFNLIQFRGVERVFTIYYPPDKLR